MLTVITGPMFAGKSSKLISMALAHRIAGHYTVCFKPSNDVRYNKNKIATHDGKTINAIPIDPNIPSQILTRIQEFKPFSDEEIKVVLVDEAQFFESKSLIKTIEDLLYIDGRTIIISGLSQDSSGKPFGAMPHLLAIADDIIHLKAVCSKSRTIGTATRTFRKDASNTNQVAVGGPEMYEPRSFNEWLTKSPPII